MIFRGQENGPVASTKAVNLYNGCLLLQPIRRELMHSMKEELPAFQISQVGKNMMVIGHLKTQANSHFWKVIGGFPLGKCGVDTVPHVHSLLEMVLDPLPTLLVSFIREKVYCKFLVY